jgi:SRSO17 transposase
VGEVETTLRRAGKGYVLGVAADRPFSSWGKRPAVSGTAEAIAAVLPASAYARLSAGEGTKGPRLGACPPAGRRPDRGDWAYLELADLDGEAEGYAGSRGLWTRGLPIRRSLADRELAFFSTWCPKATALETLVRVEGRRWAIEDAFETAKTELGLDHNETHGWHRHVSLVMLAFAMLAAVRRRANGTAPPPKSAPAEPCQWSDGRSRRSVASPAG